MFHACKCCTMFFHVTVMRQLFTNCQKTLTFGNHTIAPKRPHHCVQISVNQSVTLLTFVTHWYHHRVCQSSWGWWVQLHLKQQLWCDVFNWDALTLCGLRRAPQYNTTPEILSLGFPAQTDKPLVILKLPSSSQPSDHTHSHVKRKKTYSTYIRGQKEMHMVILR